jgi:hypothetical protein
MQTYNPHPYQINAIQLMLGAQGYAGLLLDPGMGKTSTTLATLTILKRDGELPHGALVIAPIRPMMLTWPAEVKKWADFSHLRVSIVHGTPKQRQAALAAPADLYLINPENVAWLADLTPLRAFSALVVDESTKFKNWSAQRTKALRKLVPLFARRYILTGTPMPKSLQDLFPQTYLCDRGAHLGGSLTKFRAAYFDEEWLPGVPVPLYTPKEDASERVFEAIAPFCLRLAARDYLTMPERINNTLPVILPPSARADYRKMAADFFAEIGAGTITAATAAVKMIKLRQITNGAVYDEAGVAHATHSAKLEALSDLIEEQQGAPLLVAVSFTSDVARIREHLGLSASELPYLGGGMNAKYADDVCAQWNRGELPVLLAHPASVAHGLNLQAGGHAVAWFGLTWSLEEYIQLNARVDRQGQTRAVVIHHIVAADTVDELLLEVLANKDAHQNDLFAALKHHATRNKNGTQAA